LINWSDKEDRKIFYIKLAFTAVIAVLIFLYQLYFDWQQTNAIKSRGVTVYASLDSIYKRDSRYGERYYAIAEYIFKGNSYHKTFEIGEGQYNINDTLILMVATDKNNPIYYKIMGVRKNGYDLTR
jgi:hypothetical protein